MKTAKRLLRKAVDAETDPYLAILDYRNTPTQGMESSPAQRLLNRRTRTLLPTTKSLLHPRVVFPETDVKDLKRRQERQIKYYNRTAKDLEALEEGDTVRMKPFQLGKKSWKKATVTSRLDERSYVVETPAGEIYRRNRCHLKATDEKTVEEPAQTPQTLLPEDANPPPFKHLSSQTPRPKTLQQHARSE